MLIPLISSIFVTIALVLFFDITPEKITNSMFGTLNKKQSLKQMVQIAQGKKKENTFAKSFNHTKEIMESTGKSKQFSIVCTLSLVLFFVGIIVGLLMDNLFICPIMAIIFCAIPFIYTKHNISRYDNLVIEELDTALSAITNSYKSNSNLVNSVASNTPYLKHPIRDIFESFVTETTTINPDIKKALLHLKGKINNNIFKSWVNNLIKCQNDASLKGSLSNVVTQLTDMRIINNELKTFIYDVKKEYYTMVGLVIGNVPLLYLLNKDWYASLTDTLAGKIVLAICGGVILLTAILMIKFTKPIEYGGKK